MAKKTSRTNPRGEASRQVLLDATLRIAEQRGYVGATMAQITRATGLPASSVYWHFGSKDDLLAESLEHAFRNWLTGTAAWREGDQSTPRVQRLRDHLRMGTLAPRRQLGFWRMGLLLALETGPAVGTGPRERFLRLRGEAITQLTAWWAGNLSDEEAVGDHALLLARLTLTALDGLYLARLSRPDEDLRPAIDVLARGLDATARYSLGDHARWSPTGTSGSSPDQPLSRDSRARLLRAGAEIAAESGYDGASISRICTRAGLPASSLYWHFADKDDLLANVVEHSYLEWSSGQPAWLAPAPGTTWADELQRHMTATLASLAGQPTFLRIGYLFLLLDRDDPPPGRAKFITVRRQARSATVGWFDDALRAAGGDPHLAHPTATLLMALCDGMFFSNELDDHVWDPHGFARLLVQVLTEPTTVLSS